MADDTEEQAWSYYVLTIGNPSISKLQHELDFPGADGWELVSSLTTVKTWLNVTGNDLVFVFKKRGVGQTVAVAPSVEQLNYLRKMLLDRGFTAGTVEEIFMRLRGRAWTGPSIYELTQSWSELDGPGIAASLADPNEPS